jgi:glucose-6-phosphate-specific signal transduction histidine kinase
MFSPRVNEPTYLFVVRWTARLLSLGSLGFILLFVFGEAQGWSSVRAQDVVGLVFFPFGLMLGLVLAWRREMSGGIIAVASIALFYLVYGLAINRAIFQGWWFLVLSIPGWVFLLYAVLRHEHWNGEFDSSAAVGK